MTSEVIGATSETAWERGRFDARRRPSKVLFGRMYEDASIELNAFRPGGRIFCIASGGCTAMKLAPHFLTKPAPATTSAAPIAVRTPLIHGSWDSPI